MTKRISELPLVSTITSDADVVPFLDNNVTTKRISVRNVQNALVGYGQRYISSGVGSDSLTTAYSQITQLTTNGLFDGLYATAGAGAGELSLSAGTWMIYASLSCHGDNGIDYSFQLHSDVNATPAPETSVTFSREGLGTNLRNSAGVGIIRLATATDVALFARRDSGTGTGDLLVIDGSVMATLMDDLIV